MESFNEINLGDLAKVGVIFMQAGSIVYKAKSNNHTQLKKLLIKVNYEGEFPEIFFGTENKPHISKLMQHLTEDTERNNAIIKDVSHCIQNGQIPLILTERRKHAENLRNKLNDLG